MTHLKYLHDHPKGCGPLVEDLIESMLFFLLLKGPLIYLCFHAEVNPKTVSFCFRLALKVSQATFLCRISEVSSYFRIFLKVVFSLCHTLVSWSVIVA